MAAAAAHVLPALLLLVAAHCAEAIPYIHDELLWTKQNWGEYRLPFPWAAVLKERDGESSRALQGPLRGFAANSLNGPVLDSAALSRLVQEDARRWGGSVLNACKLQEGLGHSYFACFLCRAALEGCSAPV